MEVAREDKDAVGLQQARHCLEEPDMIALDIKRAFHRFGVGERRRVEEDKPVAPPVILDPGQAIGAHDLVLC